MDAGSVFVGLHWVKRDFWDEKLQEAVALCARELHKRGRRLHVECCPRNEAAAFFQAHPEDVAYVTTATEIALDKDGRGSALTDTTPIPHYWRTARLQPLCCGPSCWTKPVPAPMPPAARRGRRLRYPLPRG